MEALCAVMAQRLTEMSETQQNIEDLDEEVIVNTLFIQLTAVTTHATQSAHLIIAHMAPLRCRVYFGWHA